MKVLVDGLMTNYVDEGEGKILVILHGWGSSSKMWQGMIRRLSKKYRVIAVDLPGFGKTDEPKAAWKVKGYAKFVEKFLEKIKVRKVRGILGHSFGGRIIIDMLDSGWEGVDKVIFVDAAGVRHAEAKSWMVRIGLRLLGWMRHIKPIRKVVVKRFGSEDYRAASPMMQEVLKLAVTEDKTRQIKKIQKDVLVVWGKEDLVTPVGDIGAFEKIPGARVVVMEGAGHNLYMDKPKELTGLVEDFLG